MAGVLMSSIPGMNWAIAIQAKINILEFYVFLMIW